MRIKKVELIPEMELLAKLKEVRLRGFGQPKIYENANLEICRTASWALTPAQKYVLEGTVQNIIDLRDGLLNFCSIDIFNLRGGILFWTDGMCANEQPIPILPPIVEKSFEPGGKEISLINDGMHRIYTAGLFCADINVILATNVPEEYPYYAYPLPGGWDEVEEVAEVPEVKKTYRLPGKDYKNLFRDFNAVFEGVQKERKRASV